MRGTRSTVGNCVACGVILIPSPWSSPGWERKRFTIRHCGHGRVHSRLQRQLAPLLGEGLHAGALAVGSLPDGEADLDGGVDGNLHRLIGLLGDGKGGSSASPTIRLSIPFTVSTRTPHWS